MEISETKIKTRKEITMKKKEKKRRRGREERRRKRNINTEKSVGDLWDTVKQTNIYPGSS